jgi:hypothetical protein
MTRTVKGSAGYRFVAILAVTLTLAACGGGGGSGTASTGQSTAPPTGNPLTANQAPVVSGTAPTTATAGKPYDFQPTATDPDKGDKVTFTIANKPAWAQFDSATGKLSGTPTDAQAGTYADIEIGATDGKDVATLPQFTITVLKGVGKNSVALDWLAPSENTDGSPLTDLQGYKLHYGKAKQTYTDAIDIKGSGVQSYVVDNLPAGTYYFAVTAVNSAGAESAYSSEVTATLN